MRQVDRSKVPTPACLQNLTPVAKSHLSNHTKISNYIYAHQDVKNSLQLLYHDKCYICECDVSSGRFDVEHYLPKKHFPQFGYTWENLHKSCGGCNLAKEQDSFFFFDANGKRVDVKLLDPSSTSYNIRDYVTFDIDSCAQSAGIGTDATVLQKAQNTILYLNGEFNSAYGKELKFLRSRRSVSFLRFCLDSNLNALKPRVLEIKDDLQNYTAPTASNLLNIDQRLCQLLIICDDEYLSDQAAFSTSVRVHLYPTLNLSYSDLLKIKNKMRTELGI